MINSGEPKTSDTPEATSSFRNLALTSFRFIQEIWRGQSQSGKVLLCFSFAFLVIARLAPLGAALVLGWLVDHLGGIEPLVSITLGLLAGYALTQILGNIIDRFSNFILIRTGQFAVTKLEDRIYEHVLRLPMSFFRDALKGGVSRAFDRGTMGIILLGVNALRTAAPILIEFLATIVVMALSFGIWFALSAVIAFGFYIWLTNRWNKQLFQTHHQMVQDDEGIAERVVESLTMGETLKSLSGVEAEVRDFSAQNARLRNTKIALDRVSLKMGIFAPACQTLILLVLGSLMVWQVVQGAATAGQFVAFITILRNLFTPMLRLLQEYQGNLTLERDSARFLGFLNLKQEQDPGGSDQSLDSSQPAIAVEGLSFGFPDREQLFNHVSLSIPGNSHAAFVGTSGSGKSTLALLLNRLEQDYEGHIHLFGQPTEALPLRQLRKMIALTPQFTHLRAGSVRENLQLAQPDANEEAMIIAAKTACLHDFVMNLPEGYETKIGEGGQKLSGGERQRLAIARTLLREGAEVYIFDEATSALDLTTEAQVMTNIREKLAGKTLIFIAHRLTTIQHVDQIFVLDKGKLVEQGSHDALLALGDTYEQLWRTQDV